MRFTDGRDCSPKSGLEFIEDLEQQAKIATVRRADIMRWIGTIIGRERIDVTRL